MCKELFPEYTNHNLTDQNTGYLDVHSPNELEFICLHGLKENKDAFILVHWFEFCIKELVDAIAWENIETDILADVEYESNRMKYITEIFKDRIAPGMYHPIDYLYGQFKQLKNDKTQSSKSA